MKDLFKEILLVLLVAFLLMIARPETLQAQQADQINGLASIGFASLLGGDGTDNLTVSAVDSNGNIYLTGSTTSSNFTVVNGFQTKPRGASDALIVKLSATGQIIYSTYLGGKGDDSISRAQVDLQGNIYLLGRTNSPDLLTKNALQTSLKRRKLDGIFLAKINPVGELIYLTYLGRGGDLADLTTFFIDNTGKVYLVGVTSFTTFPTVNAFQSQFSNLSGSTSTEDDAFITKLDESGNAVFSTYLGGTNAEEILTAQFDAGGNIYLAGNTQSKNFPTRSPFQKKFGGAKDGFITKLTPRGELVYSTFIGGSGVDEIRGMTLDVDGNVVIAGRTSSTNFPTSNAFQAKSGGVEDLFVAKFNTSGMMVYSTYLGGSGSELLMPGDLKLAIDSAGNSYLTSTTTSTNFPLRNPFQSDYRGNGDSIVAKLDSNGQLVYASYLGGGQSETPTILRVDDRGNLYVVGITRSNDLPTKNALQTSVSGPESLYVAKFDSNGGAIYSTFLGGNVGQELLNFAIDQAGNVYLEGRTRSSDLPTVNAFQPNPGGGFGAFFDIFLTKLADRGGAVYSTYLGGSKDENDSSVGLFKLDDNGNVYLFGVTTSPDFPTVNALQSTFAGGVDTYLTKFDATGKVIYSTFLGGSSNEQTTGLIVTNSGTVYLSGTTGSSDFPQRNSLQSYGGGSQDAFIEIINP